MKENNMQHTGMYMMTPKKNGGYKYTFVPYNKIFTKKGV